MAYWLLKSEPSTYSFDDLLGEPDQETNWDGVRNYQARNLLRDQILPGHRALFYHSNAKPPGIAGLVEVILGGHPDASAFDPESRYFDPKSHADAPIWYQIRIRAITAVRPILSLAELREVPGLEQMMLLKRGARLSVQPVTESQWRRILDLIRDTGREQPGYSVPIKV